MSTDGGRSTPPAMFEKVAAFAALDRKRADLQAQLDDTKDQLAALTADLLPMFEQAGLASLKVTVDERPVTVYLRRDLWARRVDGAGDAQTVAALRAAGLEDFVRESWNVQSLSAWLRERDRDGIPLPASFHGAIEATEVYSIRTRA